MDPTAIFSQIDNRNHECKTILGRRNGERTEFDFSALPSNSYAAEFQHLMRAIREGCQPEPSGCDGLRAVEVAWAVYESSSTYRRIDLSIPDK